METTQHFNLHTEELELFIPLEQRSAIISFGIQKLLTAVCLGGAVCLASRKCF